MPPWTGVGHVHAQVDRLAAKGKLSLEAGEQLKVLVTGSVSKDVYADADFVIEAATEKLDIKRSIFAALDAAAPAHAILAPNSPTLGSSAVASATGRPEKVCNMHFFNPALVMKCVEVVRHPETSQDTVDTALPVGELYVTY